MRKNRSYAVIGLGIFGMSVARALAEANNDVMVVDEKEDNIQQLEGLVTYAVKADVTEPGTLEDIGIKSMDVVIVAISENMEASITATFQAKDMGVPYVMAKAMDRLHGKILERVGADEIIYPETSTGIRVARKLMGGSMIDFFELSKDYSIVEVPLPAAWAGHSLSELDVRKRYGVNVVGLKIGEAVDVELDPYQVLPDGAVVIMVGKNSNIEIFSEEG